jgi:hypothetical protein
MSMHDLNNPTRVPDPSGIINATRDVIIPDVKAAQAIKRLVKAHSKKLLKDNHLGAGWHSIIRIRPTTQGRQDLAGCGCGCS